jgi:putative ABC transport system substrate-binding protein
VLDIRRREFITLLGGAAVAWPTAARAQQPERMQRIGVLMGYPESDSEAQTKIAAFQDGLQKLGWTEGRNTRIDTRWATPADAESMERFAKELVAPQPDLILSSTTPTTAALLQQTRTIPVVFATVADPVGSGFVASFPRPGGNLTGFVVFEASPSLHEHYTRFIATARQSAPLRRIGTFGLAVGAACAFSLSIAGQVLTFRTRA